jgi:hypothetical protein
LELEKAMQAIKADKSTAANFLAESLKILENATSSRPVP